MTYHLRPEKHHEYHQADDLPEALRRLGHGDELNHHRVPEELADEAEDHERQEDRKEDGEEVNIRIALLVRILAICHRLNRRTAHFT